MKGVTFTPLAHLHRWSGWGCETWWSLDHVHTLHTPFMHSGESDRENHKQSERKRGR
jgi:hypothetical protein